MTALATTDDLASLGGEFDDDTATQALSWASSFIETYCNRTFDFVQNEVALLTPNTGSATLPGYPVSAVSLVEGYLPVPGGMGWTPLTNYSFVPETGFLYNTSGLPGTSWTFGAYTWPWLPASLRVTYSWGYETIPQPLVDACVRIANQWLNNMGLSMSSKVGEIEDRFAGSAGVKLNEFDQVILDRFSDVSLA